MDIRAKAHEISEEMLGWRRDFHAHPELSNNEFRTTEKIVELLKSFGCDSVERPLPHRRGRAHKGREARQMRRDKGGYRRLR